jgi:hypothetical protein
VAFTREYNNNFFSFLKIQLPEDKFLTGLTSFFLTYVVQYIRDRTFKKFKKLKLNIYA